MPFLVLTMGLSIIVAMFALQNSEIVPIKFAFYEQSVSLVLVILGSAFLGLLMGASITMYIQFKNYWKNRKKDSAISDLTDENLLLNKRVIDLEAQVETLNGAKNKTLEVVKDTTKDTVEDAIDDAKDKVEEIMENKE